MASLRIRAPRDNAAFNPCRYPLRWLLNVDLPRKRRGSRKSGTCQASCDWREAPRDVWRLAFPQEGSAGPRAMRTCIQRGCCGPRIRVRQMGRRNGRHLPPRGSMPPVEASARHMVCRIGEPSPTSIRPVRCRFRRGPGLPMSPYRAEARAGCW